VTPSTPVDRIDVRAVAVDEQNVVAGLGQHAADHRAERAGANNPNPHPSHSHLPACGRAAGGH